MISIDTECTGKDLYHGALPFFVTTCDENHDITYWEWDVDPLTRQPQVPESDLLEVEALISRSSADGIVMQNGKFDVTALTQLFKQHENTLEWPWENNHDTLILSHLLASNQSHSLDNLAIIYLQTDISEYEERLKAAVQEARRLVHRKGLHWRVAKHGLPEMPSCPKSKTDKSHRGDDKDAAWKFDYWLPRALAQYMGYKQPSPTCKHTYFKFVCGKCGGHSWWTVLREYSNVDSAITLPLFHTMKAEAVQRGLWPIYEERRRLVEIAYELERKGVTVNKPRMKELTGRYQTIAKEMEKTAVEVAGTAPDPYGGLFGGDVPRISRLSIGVTKELRQLLFDHWQLPPVTFSKKTGDPSLDKGTIDHWIKTLEPDDDRRKFVECLSKFRQTTTAHTYLEGYNRYGHAINGKTLLLNPGCNPTGTDTLRWSSFNPNEQNISKRENFNLRYCFGPAPGREWWSGDAQNLELRIPAFEADEKELVYVFEHPKEPPYFGSYHLVIFDILHPELFRKHGAEVKTLFESTYYQWTKNGNFACIYGAQEKKADATYHVLGAYKKVQYRFPKIAQLRDKQMSLAKRFGYVETIPDREVNPSCGYPLLCSRTPEGGIMPTVVLNYHVSGSAMWWTARAMRKCHEQLKEWRRDSEFDGFITLQVHDELVFDFPRGETYEDNLPKILKLRRLMESCGEAIGVPTPVSFEYHTEGWDVGVKIAA